MHDSHQNELRDPLHLMTSRKLRITFVIPRDDLSGGCRMVATYAKLLQRRGHTVKVVSGVPGQLPFHERIRAIWRGEWKHAFSFEKPLAGHATQPEGPLTTVARSMADAILAICDMPDSEWNVMSHAAFAAVSGYALEDACNLFETALLKATAN